MVAKYRRVIDGLRALAVLLVLAVHASPARVPNGFIGVDIFFVISGFLITGIWMDELHSGKVSIKEFYVRRINRIFPALLLVLAFVILAGPLVMYAEEYAAMGRSAWASTIFAANIGFFRESGYWDTASKLKPLLHLWSLGVEEQFYLVWPLLLWLAFKKKISILNVAAAVVLLSLAMNIYLTYRNQAAAFYLPFGRLWELAAGGLLAAGHRLQPAWRVTPAAQGPGKGADILSWGALLLLAVTQVTPMDAKAFPGYYAIVVVMAAALFIAAGPNAWVNRRVLSNPVLVYVGKISYPLYLWHWPLLVFARLIGEGQWTSAHRNMAVAGSIVLAILTYHGLERPLAKVRRRGVLAWALISLMVLMGVLAGLAYKGILSYGVKPYEIPPQARFDYTKPAIQGTAKIALLGDSNAGHFEYGLKWIYGDRLVSYTAAGWPYLDGVKYRDGLVPHPTHKGTPAMTEEGLQKITADPAIRVVILSNAYLMYLPSDNLRSQHGAPASETGAQAYEAGIRRTVQRLQASGKKVLVVESIPTYPHLATAQACSASLTPWLRHPPEGCAQPRQAVEADRKQFKDILTRALEGVPDVSRFDTLEELCDERFCYVNRDGIQMYSDPGHVNTEGSQLIAAALARRVELLLAGP